jgi:hypothetical protein
MSVVIEPGGWLLDGVPDLVLEASSFFVVVQELVV